MITNNDFNKTTVVDIGDGWFNLEHLDGRNVWLKTFSIDGKKVTLYLDDWSVHPISLHNYDINDLIIDSGWVNLHANGFFTHTEMDISSLKPLLPAAMYKEIESKFKELFDENLTNV